MCVTLMCFLVCVLSFFSGFFCLMVGKTFVMFGYANKEFEFEYIDIQQKLLSVNVSLPI